MIMIRIEMWPHGDSSRKRDLAAITIANVGGDHERGNYLAQISHQIDSDYGERWVDHETFARAGAGRWKLVEINGFERQKGVVKLLWSVLRAAFGGGRAQ